MFPQPIRAGVKPAPTIGRPTRWVGAGFIPARTERIAALTSPLESLNLGYCKRKSFGAGRLTWRSFERDRNKPTIKFSHLFGAVTSREDAFLTGSTLEAVGGETGTPHPTAHRGALSRTHKPLPLLWQEWGGPGQMEEYHELSR